MYTYTRVDGPEKRYRYLYREAEMTISGHPAIVSEQEKATLNVRAVGHDQAEEDKLEHEDFLMYLGAYRGEWFSDNIQTPGGTDWLAEAMENGTLTSVTDRLYMEHLH